MPWAASPRSRSARAASAAGSRPPAGASSTGSARPARWPRTCAPLGLTPGLEGKRVVVQGLGNVGYHAAKFLSEDGGAVIVGAVEYEGAISKPDGIDVEA
jgi:glutamate dehydrogenase/leucine dehydrogenase